jgi:hypothetical protein
MAMSDIADIKIDIDAHLWKESQEGLNNGQRQERGPCRTKRVFVVLL